MRPSMQAVFRQGDPRTGWRNVNPDHNTLRHGVTTVVDAGSTGWKNFESFKQLVIDRSQVRVLAFLNIVGSGMLEGEAAAISISRWRRPSTRLASIPRRSWESESAPAGSRSRRCGAQHPRRRIDGGRGAGGYLEKEGLDYRQLVLERLRAGDLITHTFGLTTPLLDSNGNLTNTVTAARAWFFSILDTAPRASGSATPSRRADGISSRRPRRPWTKPASCCLVPT